MHFIVDGYNLMRTDPELAMFMRTGATLEVGRDAVVRRVDMASGLKHAESITVVFDGHLAGSPVETRRRFGRIVVIYSKLGESADSVIKRLVREYTNPQQVKVITRDNELRDAARYANQSAGVMKRKPTPPTKKPITPSKEEEYQVWNGSTAKKGNARKAPKNARQKNTGTGNDVYW